MASKTVIHRDIWGHEREGYSQGHQPAAYAPATSLAAPAAPNWLRWEERLGSLGAGFGVVWGVRISTAHPAILDTLWETGGPLELCAICTLIWLHAKWRRSTRLR